jgi:hypothetical protein
MISTTMPNHMSPLSTTPTATSQYSTHDTHKLPTASPNNTRRTLERYETRPAQDAAVMLDLPYDMLNDNADMNEYLTETTTGVVPKRTISRVTGREEDHNLVTFTIDDPENPKNWSAPYKWYCTMVVAFTCFSVAFNSSVITADLEGVMKTFSVSLEVSLLTITMFVIGFGVGESHSF